jgi:hypothetical protein
MYFDNDVKLGAPFEALSLMRDDRNFPGAALERGVVPGVS